MPGHVVYLNPNEPGLFRSRRGFTGADPRMVEPSSPILTTGEATMASPASAPLSWRTALDPNSAGFALFVLVALLFLIHARFAVGAQAAIGTRR